MFDFSPLVEQGLVKEKVYSNGLRIYKYERRVFYHNLWHEDPLLLEARGTVLDAEGNVVILPFKKVFNLGENGTEVEEDRVVDIVRKVNGFMAAVSAYNGELIYSSTGTLDSDYVKLAKEVIERQCSDLNALCKFAEDNYTLLFEITDPSDPHIVEEDFGAWLIGCRCNVTGGMMLEANLDHFAGLFGFYRPEVLCEIPFKEVKAYVENCLHEGFMVRDSITGKTLCKIKSPYYLTKKYLMRVSKRKLDAIWGQNETWKQIIEDEELFGVVEYIRDNYTKESWAALTEQERGAILESEFSWG